MLCFFLQHSIKFPTLLRSSSVNIYMFHVFMAEMPMLFLCISKFFHIFCCYTFPIQPTGSQMARDYKLEKINRPYFCFMNFDITYYNIICILHIIYIYYIHTYIRYVTLPYITLHCITLHYITLIH